jgi:rifampicin phosphotransferase
MAILGPAGGVERVRVAASGPCLERERVLALARLALEVEKLLGVPADVEAALAGDRWHLLQGRPITALGAGASVAATNGSGVA